MRTSGVIVSIVASPLALLLQRQIGYDDAGCLTGKPLAPAMMDLTPPSALLLLVGLAVALSFVYEVPQLTLWGATLGKMVCGIRVVQRDGMAKIGFRIALARWFAYEGVPVVPFVGIGYALFDDLWQLWDRPWRQCLHDKFASTIVIKTAK